MLTTPQTERTPAFWKAEPDCLHSLFERQAAKTPHAAAMRFGERTVSYADLNAQANRLARLLRQRGVGPDTLVGVCAESAPETVAALLAVLKAGGAYLPLDPAYPSERLAFMLADSSLDLILTPSHLRAVLPQNGAADCLCLDSDSALWETQSGNDLESAGTGPENLAYVIYTSGSTGEPKGVLLTHGGAVNNLLWRQASFPLTAADRMLQTYSLSFDPSVWAIFWPLTSGATLVLPRPGGIADSEYLVATMAAKNITVAGFGPAMLQTLLAHADITRCQSLRHVFCGGEAMPPGLPPLFHARLRTATLHNAYGPTETTIDAACFTVPRGFAGPDVPLGFPIAGTELWLLDDDEKPVPDGQEGELHIGGVSLARGYLSRPELTAARFIPHPFDPSSEARLYRTGDLARRGNHGEIYYRGRTDSQIKLRGYRIEPGEIEAVLCRHPQVQDAVVALREDLPGEARLVAYLVSAKAFRQSSARPAPAALRRFLMGLLPAHMVPSAFVFLDALPLTLSGKHDRRNLPPPGLETWERGTDYAPPQDPVQHQIVQIWEDLLDIRPIGIRDSFWDMGGHSLLAARMLGELAQASGQSLPMSALYESSTVEGLAHAFRHRQPKAAPPLTVISRGGTRRPFFFLYGFHPLGGFYCCHLARRLHPEQPFYAVHPPARKAQAQTIEGMAADCLRAIREVQPTGPYRLGGFCGSGLVAYEMARQLAMQGQEVEMLALIEVHRINTRLRLNVRRVTGLRRFQDWERRLLPPFAVLQSFWRRWKERGHIPEPGLAPGLMEECDRAAAAYSPGPYTGPVVLIEAADDPEVFAGDPFQLWREAGPELSVRDVPGTHLGCLLGDIGGLAACLADCLDAVEIAPVLV